MTHTLQAADPLCSIYCNTQGLLDLGKRKILSQKFISRNADVLLLIETWFNSNVLRVVFIDDKSTTISRADGTLADSGSVAIFAKSTSKATLFLLVLKFGFAMISSAILTIVIYNPPDKSPYRISDETLLNFIECCLDKLSWNTAKDILFLDDCIIPSVDWTTFLAVSPEKYSTFFNFLVFNNLLQIIDEPTHILGNSLDLAFIKFFF